MKKKDIKNKSLDKYVMQNHEYSFKYICAAQVFWDQFARINSRLKICI